jgi:hypothetical protein
VRVVRLFLAPFVVALVLVGWATGSATGAATRITAPSADPFHVALDASGEPVPFTITATGFLAGHLVFVEQCDGRLPSAPNWTPSRDCDVGGAPAPAVVDAKGTVQFLATDPNRAFNPVLGESPESLFNCIAPGGTAPKNDLTNYTNCQIRLSSNNVSATDDQVFASIVFGGSASGGGSSSSSPVGLVLIVVGVLIVTILVLVVFRRRRRSADVSA